MIRFLCALVVAGLLAHIPCHAQRRMSPGDPNAKADWDWTSGQPQGLYSGGAGGAPVAVALPFFCPGNRLLSVPGNLFQEDGWVLAHRDFGTAEAAPALPYFTLYNKYRGLFRVMVFNAPGFEDALYAGTLRLHPAPGQDSHACPLFTFSNGQGQCYRSCFDREQVEVAFSTMPKTKGWAVFDFSLIGYDPDLEKKDPLLLFSFQRLAQPSVDPAGQGSEARVMATFSASQADLEKVLATGGTGFRHYLSVHDWVAAETANRHEQSIRWFNTFQLLGQAGMGSCAPLVEALGGLVEGWLGGTYQACAWEPIGFRGQVKVPLREALPKDTVLALALYLLPDELKQQEVQGHRPVQLIPWGLFNFEERPGLVHRSQEGPGKGKVTTIVLEQESRLLINPAMDMELRSKAFEAELWSKGPRVYCGLLPISPRKGPSMPADYDASDLLVTLAFQTKQPTREADRFYTVVKRLSGEVKNTADTPLEPDPGPAGP